MSDSTYFPRPEWWEIGESSKHHYSSDEDGRRVYFDEEWPRSGINTLSQLGTYVSRALELQENLSGHGGQPTQFGLEHGKRAVRNARRWLQRHRYRGIPHEPPSLGALDGDAVEAILRRLVHYIDATDETSSSTADPQAVATTQHNPRAADILAKLGADYAKKRSRCSRAEKRHAISEREIAAFQKAARIAVEYLPYGSDSTTVEGICEGIRRRVFDESSWGPSNTEFIRALRIQADKWISALIPSPGIKDCDHDRYRNLSTQEAEEWLKRQHAEHDSEWESREEAVSLHPLDGVCEWMEKRTGVSRDDFRVAATGSFAGQSKVIDCLNSLDERGETLAICQKLNEQYPDLMRSVGLSVEPIPDTNSNEQSEVAEPNDLNELIEESTPNAAATLKTNQRSKKAAPTRKKVDLKYWAIGAQDGKRWFVFRFDGIAKRWNKAGDVIISKGNVRALALEFLKKKGSLSRKELLELLPGVFKSTVKPTLKKLNRALKEAIVEAAKTTFDSVNTPIFHDEPSDRWQSHIKFDYAEDSDGVITLQNESD